MNLIVDHLRLIKGAHVDVSVWEDRKLDAGQNFRAEIARAIADTQIAILVVTKSFFNSSFIQNEELPPLLAREREGKTQLVPLLADHCAWELDPVVAPRQVRPRPAVPLAAHSNPNAPMARLVHEVSLLLDRSRLQATGGGDRRRVRNLIDEIEESLRTCWDSDEQPRRIDAALTEIREQALDEAKRRRQRPHTRVAGPRPRSVPISFKDRTEEQRQINALLAHPESRVVQVIGRGGMGKTALACQVLAGLEQNQWPSGTDGPFVAGIIYLSTKTLGITLDRIHCEFATLLSPDETAKLKEVWCQSAAHVDDKIVRLLQATQGGLYVFLLDNVEELLDDDGQLVDPGLRRLLELATSLEHGARFLITSRRSLSLGSVGNAAREVLLAAGLPLLDAKNLLQEMLSVDSETSAWPAAKIEALAERFFGVPRALELVAGALLNDPFMTPDDLLAAKGTDSASEAIVRTLAEQTYGRLNQDALFVLQGLAVFGRAIKPVAVDFLLRPHVAGIDAPKLVRRLSRTHLIATDRQSKSISLHPIDREFLYQTLASDGPHSRRELHRTAAQYYASEQVVGSLDWQVLCELDPYVYEFEHLLEADDFDQAALKLGAIANRMTWRGMADRVRAMLSRLDGRVNDKHALLSYHLASCANMTVLGPFADAVRHGEHALELAESLSRLGDAAHAHWMTALAYRYHIGIAGCTEAGFLKAIAANEAAGTQERNPQVLCELSLGLSYQREPDRALERAEEAKALLASSIGSRLRSEKRIEIETHVWQAIGYAKCLMKSRDEAIAACERAIEVWGGRSPVSQVCGYAMHTIALAHALVADYAKAAPVWEQTREAALAQGQPRLDAICAFNLAILSYLRGERGEALVLCRSAEAAFERIKMGNPARALASWLSDARPDAAATCAKACDECPDLYGQDLFHQWASA